ncbi:MAG: T9SS type A sorting domain-containing protein [Candidatus Eisenbacteria bacterium]|uniref:T9SS type A sorting domain-containing protein n=1 Tax=Eiseniibacteriota bacterium TaxID=2212470 RepID=A0A7Y2EAV8_UNCEI|nr:T9SS type A sorting domain-containing protein [Candidatus Eisenbacteria bacterium]
MLQLAATLEVENKDFGISVRVYNETAHKLPSGYPEGRRIWLNVVAKDSLGATVYESGAYNFATGELTHDEDSKIYEIHPGLSPSLASALSLPSGESFHFVLNDTVYFDNRIPPRGFTNANFETIQSAPVAYAYADSQYWDDTDYYLPAESDSVTVTLYYQTTSKEYIEFLRDENTTNSAGQDLYDAWVAAGKAAPVVMEQATLKVDVTETVGLPEDPATPVSFGLSPSYPNPFKDRIQIHYNLPQKEHVHLEVFDVAGRRVKVLVDQWQRPDRYDLEWDGRDQRGRRSASGIYFIHFRAGGKTQTQRLVLTG